MSNRLCHAGVMKIKRTCRLPLSALHFQTSTVARFGSARLLNHFDGRHELIGGTAENYAAAREWCSLFAPEVVFKSAESPVQTRSSIARSHFTLAAPGNLAHLFFDKMTTRRTSSENQPA